MKWHRFGQDGKFDPEAFRWTEVMPGDVVQSRGTFGYKQRDFLGRNEDDNTPLIQLHSAPVLVVARIPGIPGEAEPEEGMVTFLLLTRHGLVIVVQPP